MPSHPHLSMRSLNRWRDVLYSRSDMATVNETMNSVLIKLILSLDSEFPTCPQNVFYSYFCKSACNRKAHTAYGCYETLVSFNLLFMQVSYLGACHWFWGCLTFLYTVAFNVKTISIQHSIPFFSLYSTLIEHIFLMARDTRVLAPLCPFTLFQAMVINDSIF